MLAVLYLSLYIFNVYEIHTWISKLNEIKLTYFLYYGNKHKVKEICNFHYEMYDARHH